MNIKQFLDRQRQAARRRTKTDGTPSLPATAAALRAGGAATHGAIKLKSLTNNEAKSERHNSSNRRA